VPNAALRYKPDLKSEELRDALSKAGIQMAMRGQGSGAPGGGAQTAGGQRSGGGPGGAGQRPERGAGNGAPRPNQGEGPSDQQPRKEAPRANDIAVVWKMLPDKKMEPVQIRTGITDHTTTQIVQVLKGELKEGDTLVTGASRGSANRGGSSPLGGAPRGPR